MTPRKNRKPSSRRTNRSSADATENTRVPVMVRFSREEYARLKAAAEEAGDPVAKHLWKCAAGLCPPPIQRAA